MLVEWEPTPLLKKSNFSWRGRLKSVDPFVRFQAPRQVPVELVVEAIGGEVTKESKVRNNCDKNDVNIISEHDLHLAMFIIDANRQWTLVNSHRSSRSRFASISNYLHFIAIALNTCI